MRRFVYFVAFTAAACAHGGSRESLLKADADWDAAVAERGVEAWAAQFADDGAMFVGGAPRIADRERIAVEMADLGDPRKAPGGLSLRWRPLGAEVSADGTLGFTWGSGVTRTAAGEKRVKYVTVWRRVGDRWKVVADMGAAGEP